MSPSLFTCPRCREPLTVPATSTAAIDCEACGRSYPRAGGIPLLMVEPEARLKAWSALLSAFVEETDQAAKHLAVQLLEEPLMASSRARLTAVVEALPAYKDRIVSLFAQAGLEPTGSASSAEGDPLAVDSVLAYYSLIHRDWSWLPQVDEVTPSVEAIRAVLPPEFQLGNTLVLGAGTARLAWELGQRLEGRGSVLALDINPLPFLVTQSLMQGKPLELYELPGHPRKTAFASVVRRLVPPGPPPEGLQLVFADALTPPVAAHSFDTVVTPWFVDQVPRNLATLPALIHGLLKEGGSWINHGPFVYDPARTLAAHRYCADEFLPLVAQAGFQVTNASYESVPYLASPVSSQGRTERVLTMHATKRGSPPSRQAREQPLWLAANGASDLAVPVPEGLSGLVAAHPLIAQVAALIDGTRTPSHITAALVQAGDLADDGTAEVAVIGCLKIIWKALREQ